MVVKLNPRISTLNVHFIRKKLICSSGMIKLVGLKKHLFNHIKFGTTQGQHTLNDLYTLSIQYVLIN